MNKKAKRLPVRVVFWPVILGIFCLNIILALNIFLPPKTWERWEGKLVDAFVLMVATFVSAWAGGASAFRVERRTQEINARNARISAANKAIFTVATAYLAYANLRAAYIDVDGLRNDTHRALKMDSPQPGMLPQIEFDFAGLEFLLDQAGTTSSQIVMEFVLFQ
ncbi:hypothetical protein [Ralstonia solanacearum]|uniref:hypothetical protein n=1 Tax=Ralstonia solanacearum TaxID=305 RepID=UPI00070AD08B|nr:hypothetical protein [Ralstonia solanacearum]